ncbi:MAG: molybdenum cofactor guanylyltransferase [Bacillota bacterium]
MRSTSDVTAVVLAGGKATRMGCEKALISFGGRPLVEHVVARVRPLAAKVLVVTSGREGRDSVAFLERPGAVEVVTDLVPRGGPLAGIHAGLVASRAERCVVVGCDMPFLSAPLLAHLAGRLAGADAVVPRMASSGFVEPLAAAYSRSCISAIERLLSAGACRVARLFDEVHVEYVDEGVWRSMDRDGLSFFNINTPGDLARATALMGGCPHVLCAWRRDAAVPRVEIRTGCACRASGRSAQGGDGPSRDERGEAGDVPVQPHSPRGPRRRVPCGIRISPGQG